MPQGRETNAARKAIVAIVLIIITIIYMIPLFYIVNTAFRPWSDIREYPPKLIYQPSIGSFIRIFTARAVYPPGQQPTQAELAEMTWAQRKVFEETNERIVRRGDLPRRYVNSLIICVLSTAITIALGTMAAYGFSRFPVKGKDDWMFFILSTRMLPPVIVAIPVFLMFRNVGLNDSHFGLILLYVAFNVSFAVWVLKGFIDEIPQEYEEAALVDGYSRFQAFWKIVLPQSITGIAATAVFVFIFAWNEYAFAFMLTRNTAQTVPAWLPYQMGVLGFDWGAAAAGTSIFIIPPMVLTILLRNQLVRGISFGAVRK